MDKENRFRERILKGNKNLLIQRAHSYGLDLSTFLKKIACSKFSLLDPSAIALLEMIGSKVPNNIKTKIQPIIQKKNGDNTEVLSFDMTDNDYQKLQRHAIIRGFSSRGGVGLLLDSIACFELIFKIEDNALNKSKVNKFK